MLELDDVSVGYDRTTVVHGVSLRTAADGITTVLGHNGAGKTTLLRAVLGLLKPTRGRILLDGEDITALPTHQRVRRGLGFVPQGQQSFGDLSTEENLRVVADSVTGGRKRIAEVLELFPALAELRNRPAGLLSGGQRQQLAIARALLRRPRVLLLDEPTEGIQPSVVAEIERTVLRLVTEQQVAVLLVEQQVGFGLDHAARYAVLESGRITRQGRGGAGARDEVRGALML
ncbi:ATP-binding cassette domain-containing protein [Enemella evansiae]|uniref:ATP-binding cassette domain-containing protein n=1 Tax=Enemella evansiae TaxID=2016499 RepID=UPI000B960500|nr:ATP-binding cassette domain-containing protein [Enemella evansiae]OYN93726.1 ABC transporter ATP-binding protein [Enemella evansiae]OYO05804.1 ABC transporter ATP-binding protein [Enemella evansiae]PFG66710.1 urea transport system ATP-binding protein [Propionibacteriaceae bacterium ES.041]